MLLEIVEYDPRWPELFALKEAQLAKALGSYAAEFQHVGSTAVPGLAAKPIIDIAIGIRAYPWPSAPIEAMIARGYEHKGEYGIRGGITSVKECPVPTTCMCSR